MNHMLNLFAKHGQFDLSVQANGDTDVDDHHTTEDIGICLGQVVKEALGTKKGLNVTETPLSRWMKRWLKWLWILVIVHT